MKSGGASAAKVGAHLGVSGIYVLKLARDGVVNRRPDRRFDLDDCRLGYLRWLRDPARRSARSEAQGALYRIRAREIELKLARQEGELMTVAEAVDIVDQIVGLLRAELGGLPARVTRDLKVRRSIEIAVDDLLGRIADVAEENAKAIRGVRAKHY